MADQEVIDLILRAKDMNAKVKFAREKFMHCCRFEDQAKREEARTELLLMQESEVDIAAEIIDLEEKLKKSTIKDILRRGQR